MIADQNKIIQQFLPRVIYWCAAGLLTLLTSSQLAIRPQQTLIALGLLALLLIMFKNPRFGLGLMLLLTIAGELIRIPLGPSNGILLTDIFIPLLILAWIARNISGRQNQMPERKSSNSLPASDSAGKQNPLPPPDSAGTKNLMQKSAITLPFILFIVMASLSLVQSLAFLAPAEVMGSSLYLIRFLQYGLLFFITLQTVRTPKQIQAIIKIMAVSALLLALAGFVQLSVYPDLAALEEQGYDPHINRLVSTWLDPNFVGGFLAYMVSILLGMMLHAPKLKSKMLLLTVMAVLGAALFFTFSRSAYLALAAGIIIISLLKSRKILIISLALFIIGLGVSPRAQERVAELAQSVTSLTSSSAETPDPTAKLRLQSWRQTLQLIQKRPLLGSGYNTLRAVNYQEGYIKDKEIHSGSGSDSSLLTILATTGILGFIPFLLLYILPLKTAFRAWRDKKIPASFRGFSLGLMGGIAALLVHSVFVNSLLFPSIMIFFWISLGLLERIKKTSTPDA